MGRNISLPTKIAVLTEAGYRCAAPTCRTILALDLHHIVEVANGGKNTVENLIALCPTCHQLYHRGTIKKESIYVWKQILVSLSSALDIQAVDDLVFLYDLPKDMLGVSGDGVLQFRKLIAAGLAGFRVKMENGPFIVYEVGVTSKGAALVDAWRKGDAAETKMALYAISTPFNLDSTEVKTNN